MLNELRNANAVTDPDFPHAPQEWTRKEAAVMALEQGLNVADGHWDLVRALHEYFARHEESGVNSRELQDALEERFHSRGGMKYLYQLFPGGPINQGCQLAGLEPPSGSVDRGFGSVR